MFREVSLNTNFSFLKCTRIKTFKEQKISGLVFLDWQPAKQSSMNSVASRISRVSLRQLVTIFDISMIPYPQDSESVK